LAQGIFGASLQHRICAALLADAPAMVSGTGERSHAQTLSGRGQ